MPLGLWIALGIVVLLALGLALRSRDTTVTPPQAGEGPPSAPQFAAAAPQADLDFERLLPRIELKTRETAFFGRWWQGELQNCPVALQPAGKGVTVFAGDFDPDREQISEVYLSQVSETRSLPAERSARRLRRVLGDAGGEIDERFFLNATGGEVAELRSAAVRSALLGLSESVEQVMLFQSGGVQIVSGAGSTPATVAADLERAVEIHAALRTQR